LRFIQTLHVNLARLESDHKIRKPKPMRKSNRSRIRFSSTASMAAASMLLAAPSSFALTYYWDNNGATAGFGTAAGTWADPTTGDATQGWSQDSTGGTLPVNVTTTTSDTVNFGTATALATGTVNVTGTVSATRVNFGSGSGTITLSGGTLSLGGSTRIIEAQSAGTTIGSNISFGGNGTISCSRNTATASTMTINGQISGTGTMTFTTPNVNSGNTNQIIVLGAANSWSGNTTITTANVNNTTIIRNGVNDALPTGTVLTLDGGNGPASVTRTVTFDLNSKNQTIAGLTNITGLTNRNQRIANNGSGTATLTINSTSNYSFSGNINGTALKLAKTGTGTQTLGSTNGYTGTTTVSGGKLVGVVGGNHSSSDVTVDNAAATYGVSITDNTKSWTCKSLATTAAGTLEFSFGSVTPSTSVSPLIVTNAATFTATPAVSVQVSAGLSAGTYPLMTWGSSTGTAPATANLTISQLAFGTTADLQVSGSTLNLVITSTIVPIVKQDNPDNLNSGTSWVGGIAPGAGDLAKWNNIVNSANTTVLGADVTWAGMIIENPNGLVTIGGSNTLTLGAANTDIDLSSADTANLTLNCPLALGAANVWNVASGRTLTVGGSVSGNFLLTTQGGGTVRLGAGDVLPNGTGNGNVSVDSTLDLNGFSETLNGLSGAGIVDNATNSTSSTLTVGGNDESGTFSGVLQNSGTSSTLNLIKTGAGSQTLSGANAHTGSTAINGGTLKLGNQSALGGTTGIAMAGGTALVPTVSGANAIDISVPITVGATGTTATITAPDVPGSGTTNFPVTISGGISGDGNVNFSGVSTTNAYGVINLNAACDYAGSTLITTISAYGGGAPNNANIFMNLGVENTLPVTTVVTLDGGDGGGSAPGRFCELDLNGNNQTIAGLTNVTGRASRVQRVVNNSLTAATLTINNSADFTYSGQLGWVSGYGSAAYNNYAVTKSGSGSMTFAGVGNYTGATTVTGGKLFINGNQTGASGAVSVSGGATLGGTGTIGGDVTIAATGKLEFDISTDAASHNKLDLAATKTLAFSGSSVLTITSSGGTPAIGLYTLVTAPGGITGSAPATVVLPAGWTADPPAITGVGNTDLVINITSIGSGAPEIAVEQPAATDIPNGGSQPFGTVTTGSNTSLTFTIRNTGTSALNLTGSPLVAVSGTNAADFTVTAVPTTPVTSGGGTTTFTVQFAPGASGARSAVLTIANDDSDEGTFTINVSGTGQTPYEAWAGGAAFNADANGDGVKNGMAFLLGASGPSGAVTLPTVSQASGNLTLSFNMLKPANRGTATLSVQHSRDLGIADPWTTVPATDVNSGPTSGVTFTITPGGGSTNGIQATIGSAEAGGTGKLFGRLQANP
jgi:autotransporter-associated beta strand protein